MFLGGDQYRNDLSNNLIIKCHECGDTNLRYLGSARTGSAEKPYICGNGHTTWGAIDDWSIKGQTDTLFNEVNDCCCEGVECEFPKSIKVNFSGLIGVQAREGGQIQFEGQDAIYRDNLSYDLRSRQYNPFSMCPPCYDFDVNYSEDNGSWSFNCGDFSAAGSCRASDDSADYNSLLNGLEIDYCSGCGEFITNCLDDGDLSCRPPTGFCEIVEKRILFGQGLGVGIPYPNGCLSYNYPIGADPPGGLNCCSDPAFYSTTYSFGPLFTSIPDIGGPTFLYEQLSKGNDGADCPEPTQTFYGSTRNPWEGTSSPDSGESSSLIMVKFRGTKIKSKRVGEFGSCCCVSVHEQNYYLYRAHPTSSDNALGDWVLSQAGINEAYKDVTYVNGDCDDCSYEDPGLPSLKNISISNFCNPSNTLFACTDCMDSLDINIPGDISERRIWPLRIPAFESAGVGPTEFQLIRNASQGFDGGGEITQNECGCRDRLDFLTNLSESLPCYDEPPTTGIPTPGSGEANPCGLNVSNTKCEKYIDYPTCLEKGNLKCTGIDSKYRVSCSDPSDYFTVNLVDAPFGMDQARYTLSFLQDPKTWCGLWQINVLYHPQWEGRITVPAVGTTWPATSVDIFSYPLHPNPECTNSPGVVYNYGFPPNNNQEIHPLLPIAQGIKSLNVSQIEGGIGTKVQQPHCLRRVKNPSVNSFPYWAVNTADISNQTLILDRYYPTGNGIDYAFEGVSLSEDGVSSQPYIANKGDVGVTDYSTGRQFPFPFTAHSGSLEEPELIAIIHSESGTGGQVAFQTFPVSYETDELLDIEYDILKPAKGTCLYKHRVTAHGYGVMYPMIDDPFWNEPEFEYPVILPGEGYEIGDKIEFRCWKCLEDADQRNANPGENEQIWGEECVETIIATATITELNDERVSPEIVAQVIDGKISITTKDKNTDRYHETYTLDTVNIEHTGVGYDIDDVIYISFTDTDTRDNTIHYDVQPYVTVTATGISGVIEDFEITESGEFYKIVGNGGIRWYEFDEEDDNQDLLISVGNCPCEYDVCADPDFSNPTFTPETECIGCISKTIYPSGHPKIDALPQGFPAFPNFGCLFDENKVVRKCDGIFRVNCSSNCSYTYNCAYVCETVGEGAAAELNCSPQPFWIKLNDDDCSYNSNCFCTIPDPSEYPSDPSPGDKYSTTCTCVPWTNASIQYVAPFSNPGMDLCFPINNTWEFYPENYARSACSGQPVSPATRPYMDGITVMPPKKAQYKAIWLPKTNEIKQALISALNETELTTTEKNAAVDQFLSAESCNPLKLDRFNRSYKFPNFNFSASNSPCRKSNDGDSLPINHTRTIDDYCRVYGFYQQRQPSCEVIYKGQYILRTAEKITGGFRGTDCEPLIEDIEIILRKQEAKIDISVGAPYNQDFLIPESLPLPYLGQDGKLESTADAWNNPSLVKTDNERFFDHGFFEPNRKANIVYKEISGESTDETDFISVLQVNPSVSMYNIDGFDLVTNNNSIKDYYLDGVWDLPDPRSNIRAGTSGLQQGDSCENPLYTGIELSGFPASGLRNSFIGECPYPWENQNGDHYCMFKNNSAEIVVSQIEDCEYCAADEIVKYGKSDYVITSYFQPYIPESYFYYTYRLLIESEIVGESDEFRRESFLLFKCYGSSAGDFDKNTLSSLIDNYMDIWIERKDVDDNQTPGNIFLDSLSNDTEQKIFSNFIFEGANNNQLNNLTKIEIYNYSVTFTSFFASFDEFKLDPFIISQGWDGLQFNNFSKIYEESRCLYPKRGGSIKELTVLNSGNGYAFEIEERVPPTGVEQIIESGLLTISTVPLSLDRRRETYAISGIDISHSGIGYEVDDVINISFNDDDYRREQIFIETQPSVRITGVDESGTITGWRIENSGEFYKYVGTGEHRAFPISMVVNNYWNHPNRAGRELGKNAILRPIIGVDPSSPETYGKIKRVAVEYGGIDYVEPTTYWTIDTKTGKYDTATGELIRGLDVHHLVDPAKFTVAGNGITPSGLLEYKDFLNPAIIYRQQPPFNEILYPELISPGENPFLYNTKYYYHTGADINGNPIKWQDKTEDWDTVIYSGSCPFVSGGLFDRTYRMALIEEVDLTGRGEYYPVHPNIGVCDSQYCDQLISHPACVFDPKNDTDDFLPDVENYNDCNPTGCNVFTVYDAHRYPISHIGYQIVEGAMLGSSFLATPAPFIQGCLEQRPIYDALKPAYCNVSNSNGYTDLKVASNPSDKCSDCEYSLYAEFAKIQTDTKPGGQGIIRAKNITYKMQDPITMTINFNDDDHDEYLGSLVCPSGDTPLYSGLQEICECQGE